MSEIYRDEIVFDAEKHQYQVDGKLIPSVTEILSVLSFDTMGQISKEILDYAARRGTAIHEATEAIDMGAEAEVDAETEPYVCAYMNFLADYRPNWMGIEEIVYNPDQGYAGTVDRFGYFGTTPVVLDIKTNSSPNKVDYTKVCLQTYLYSLCLAYDNPRLFALYLKKDGSYRLLDCRNWWSEHQLEPIYHGGKDILTVWKTINFLKKGTSK